MHIKALTLEEAQLLLNLNQKLASSESIDILLEILINEIKSIAIPDNAYFSIYNYETNSLNHYSSDNGVLLKDIIKLREITFPIENSLYELSFNQDLPLILDNSTINNIIESYWELKIWNLIGIKEIVCIQLKWNNNKIGILTFGSKTTNSLSKVKLEFYKNIGNILAVTISNILSILEVIESEKEKAFLLEISEDIANIRTREELYELIFLKFQPIYGFNEYVSLTIYNEKNQTLKFFSKSKYEDAIFKIENPFKITGLFTKLLETKDVFILDERWETIPKSNEFDEMTAQIWNELDFKYSLSTALRNSDRLIGTFHVHFYENKIFTYTELRIFKAISDHLAIALSNIVANEELEANEKEKSLLLSLSEKLVKVRDYSDLYLFIKSNLAPFLGNSSLFDLSIINSDNVTYKTIFNTNFDNIYINNERQIAGNELIEENNIFKFILLSQKPLFFNIDDLKNKYLDEKKLNKIFDSGVKNFLGCRLEVGDKVIGILELYLKESALNDDLINLFQSISEQLAIAISNIIANLEIKNHLEEIKKLNQLLLEQNSYLIEEVDYNYNFEDLIGESEAARKVYKQIHQVAKKTTSVLIMGETGTGKELVARAIHNQSDRKAKPLVKINCASIPSQLIESELFGHEKGSFTGAFDKRIGKFEIANGSTILLDEIGELSFEIQAKLLRVLQERELERLGSNKTISIDVRIIASTNRNLEEDVKNGKFRSDLFYRLNVFPINLPPLKERKEDIPRLTLHFINKNNIKLGKKIIGVSPIVTKEMMGYEWPGNIRELEHTIERAVILSKTSIINEIGLNKQSVKNTKIAENGFIIKPLFEHEKDYILYVLKACNGKVKGAKGAAAVLGLPPTTLASKMQKLGIKKEHIA